MFHIFERMFICTFILPRKYNLAYVFIRRIGICLIRVSTGFDNWTISANVNALFADFFRVLHSLYTMFKMYEDEH